MPYIHVSHRVSHLLRYRHNTSRLQHAFLRLFCTESVPRKSVGNFWSAPPVKSQEWNKAVSDAERLVGYPTTYFSLKCLLTEEFTSIAQHLQKLLGTNHPILRTAKRLVYHGRTNLQTRGLVILLISKAAGHTSSCSDLAEVLSSGITPRQQNLAEIAEMIHTAHLIHKGILNLSPESIPNEEVRHDLQFGNKISILSGDYFLANACKGLANLRNCTVVDLISKAIADFMQSEFLGEYDKDGNSLPTGDMDISFWEEKNFLSAGSLMANSCKSAMVLAGHDDNHQEMGLEFGRNIGLAWQVYGDLQPFVDTLSNPPEVPFNLTSLPVIFYLKKKPSMLSVIRREIGDSVTNLNYKNLHQEIMDTDSVEEAKQYLRKYSQNAEDLLQTFEPSPATKALSNIINSLKL